MSPPVQAAGTPADTSWAAALDRLAHRYSVGPKFLAPPSPTLAQWQRAAQLALRAPDHGGLRPFRFVIVDDDQRPVLSELFARAAVRRGQAADAVDKARARAFNGPGLVALLGRLHEGVADVPLHEQWLCMGAALMNFLNALHLMGFGAKALSGASVSDPDICSAFCSEGETLVTWVVAGRPLHAAHPKRPEVEPRVIDTWSPR
jgi:nitroreductase